MNAVQSPFECQLLRTGYTHLWSRSLAVEIKYVEDWFEAHFTELILVTKSER